MAKVFITRLLDRGYGPTTIKEWFSECSMQSAEKSGLAAFED
jgi:hypothetical protein